MSQKSSGRFADQKIRITGKNCKLTVFYNGVVCGRIFLPTEGGPSIRGGGFDLAYLPGCWSLEGNNRISLLAEAVGPDEAEIEKIEFLGVE